MYWFVKLFLLQLLHLFIPALRYYFGLPTISVVVSTVLIILSAILMVTSIIQIILSTILIVTSINYINEIHFVVSSRTELPNIQKIGWWIYSLFVSKYKKYLRKFKHFKYNHITLLLNFLSPMAASYLKRCLAFKELFALPIG